MIPGVNSVPGAAPVRDHLRDILAGLFAALFFSIVLLIRIPPNLSRVLSAFSLPLFIVVLLLYFLAFRLPENWLWLVVASLTMLLLGLSLSFLWSSGYSDDKIIGGLLPFRDGFDYYTGANRILSGHFIKIIDEGAAWRPLYPGFLSALLLLTQRNLQGALAIQVAVAGLCVALSARYLGQHLGAAAAAVFVTFLYFYIQPLIGTAYTETLGLTLGCLAVVLLWQAAETRSVVFLLLGLVTLMLAVSARAGAFFIFPALIAWAGWAFRGDERFSWRVVGIALGTVVISYLVFNTVFDRLIVEPGGSPFGNFAFTLYGQVVGGAGYHKAFEDLGVRNPALILRAAQRFFLAHPLSFGVGAAKSYRDFFSPAWGAFSLAANSQALVVGLAGSALMLLGIYRSVKRRSSNSALLLLAGFLGILLSVPFLPPIDGGMRIYAATMPFVYALAAVPMAWLFERGQAGAISIAVAASAGVGAAIVTVLSVVAPIAIRYAMAPSTSPAISCPAGQLAFETAVNRGSFIDLVPDGVAVCGRLPDVCLSQFGIYSSSNDPSDMSVYEQLTGSAGQSKVQVFAGIDFVSDRPHLFVGSPQQLAPMGNVAIGGCATETLIKGRPSIYAVQSISGIAPP